MSLFKPRKAPENIYLINKLESLRKAQIAKREDRKSSNTNKVIKALEKLPFPLVSGKMAQDLLQGAGPFYALQIDQFLRDKPAKRMSTETIATKHRKIEVVPGSTKWAILYLLFLQKALTLTGLIEGFVSILEPQFVMNPRDPLQQELDSLTSSELLAVSDACYSLTAKGELQALSLSKSIPAQLFKPQSTSNFDPDSWLSEPADPAPLASQNTYEFQVILQVDTAERLSNDFSAIQQRLSNRGLNVQVCKLWVGDYQWVCRGIRDFHLGIIVERKTADDLAASIIDGRYVSQKLKMKATGIKCIYLLEGTKPSNHKITKGTLLNALFGTILNYGFQVRISKDTGDTLNWLARMTAGIQLMVDTWTIDKFRALKTVEEFYACSNPNGTLTVRMLFGRQLRSLDSFGEQSTLAVLKRFGCPAKLFEELNRAKGKKEVNRFFREFRHEGGNRISKKLKDIILKLFWDNQTIQGFYIYGLLADKRALKTAESAD